MESNFAQPVPRACASATVGYYKFKKEKKSLKMNIQIRVAHRWFESSASSQDTLGKKTPNIFLPILERITQDI